jgi:lipase ATG15
MCKDANGHAEPMPMLMAGSQPILMAKQSTRVVSNGRQPNHGGELLNWAEEVSSAPNTNDRDTLINLARMSSDAYSIDPLKPDWMNITNGFNSSSGFGWTKNETGLRGHVFANLDNSTVIIAFKGTSVDPRDTWAKNDKLNDNLLFSCCCATQRPDPYWYGQVCDCRIDTYKCNSTCLTQELITNRTYYPTALNVYFNVTKIYPNADIWTTGHSMGGAIASLVGLTFNIPAVTFEAPPQALAAERLGLAVYPDPRLHGAYHFGNTGDPIFMGACNGWTSSCAIAGLAFESQCFTGQRCVYDTVADKGWHMSITNHRINYVIPNVLEAYDTVANCTVDDECVDCYEWYFS